MNFRLFQYALPAPPLLEDVNAYLGAHRVASVATHLVPVAGGTMLVFIVQAAGGGAATTGGENAGKIDYRERLNAEEFTLFNRLREERKKWAETEGVPVYALFSNAQLAAMVQKRVRTAAALGTIEGVGAARLEKYGAQLLEILATGAPAAPASRAQERETSQ